jgi:hypothetical protein
LGGEVIKSWKRDLQQNMDVVSMWRREEARDTPTRTSSEAPECEIKQPKAKADSCYPSRVIDNPLKDAGCHNRPQDMENRASRSLSYT